MKKLTLFFLTAFLIISCSEDDSLSQSFNQVKRMPVHIYDIITEAGDSTIVNTSYLYNNQDQLTQIIYDVKEKTAEYKNVIDINYNSDGSISDTNSTFEGYTKYVYKSGGIIILQNEEGRTDSLYISNNGRLLRSNIDNVISEFIYDEAGNLITETINGDDVTNYFKYDQKNGIFRDVLPSWFITASYFEKYFLANNCLLTEASKSGKRYLYEICEYEYDTYGFPIVMKEHGYMIKGPSTANASIAYK